MIESNYNKELKSLSCIPVAEEGNQFRGVISQKEKNSMVKT